MELLTDRRGGNHFYSHTHTHTVSGTAEVHRQGNTFSLTKESPLLVVLYQREPAFKHTMNLKHCAGDGRFNYTLVRVPLTETEQIHRDVGFGGQFMKAVLRIYINQMNVNRFSALPV